MDICEKLSAKPFDSIFLCYFRDSIGVFKMIQIIRIPYQHNLLKTSRSNILKSGSLFTCTDAAADNSLLLFRIKCNLRSLLFFSASKHFFILFLLTPTFILSTSLYTDRFHLLQQFIIFLNEIFRFISCNI